MSTMQYREFLDAEASANLVADPGNAGVIDPTRFGSGTCAVTIAGSETRVLRNATLLPLGIRLAVPVKGTGSVVITQQGTASLDADVLEEVTAEPGALVEFVVGYNTAGAKSWRWIGGAIVAS